MHLPDPRFPPLFTGHAVKAPANACDEACRRAAAGDLGAGDLVWSRNTSRAECALILEPEVSLARSCQMAALAHVALAETLGHVGPPQMPIGFLWPSTILVDGAACGSVTLAAPPTAAAAVPPWLVVATTMTITLQDRDGEPGDRLDATALALEGAGDVTRTALVEALATRLLAWLHSWNEDGFRPIHDQWLFRADGRERDITVDGITGRVVGLDEDANLLLKPVSGPVRAIAYLPHVRIYR